MNPIKAASTAYMLTICHKLADRMFINLVKKYERYNVVACKYTFNIRINLHLEDTGNFVLNNAYYTFLDENNKYTEKILLDGSNIPVVPTIIRRFANYQKLLITVILDFGRNTGFVHQGAIIVDYKLKKILFYEPYGTYNKHNANYDSPVKQYIQSFSAYLPEFCGKDNLITFCTFHEHIQQTKGIQIMILEKNNSKETQFHEEFKVLLNKLPIDLQDRINARIASSTLTKSDNTIDIIFAFEVFRTYAVDDENLWKEALEILYKYDSKTCVSITLIELNKYFSDNLSELHKFYEDIKIAEFPGTIIMNDILSLIIEFNSGFEKNIPITFTENICDSI